MKNKTVAFLGPLPPPLHGFSNINQKFYSILSASVTVDYIDCGSNRHGIFGQAFFTLKEIFRIFFRIWKIKSAYICLSGGKGKIRDALFIFIFRVTGKKIFVHHHSFQYINRYSPLFHLTFLLGGSRVRHIFLCGDMRQQAKKLYCLENSIELSNLAFFDADVVLDKLVLQDSESNSKVFVGIISNLTREKGIFDFLEVARDFVDDERVAFVVAGPLDKKIEGEFFEKKNKLDNVFYLGPIYGEEKSRFFTSIDLFLFPSAYKNEAEPLVVHEALLHGCKVVASDVGCLCSFFESSSDGVAVSLGEWKALAVDEIAAHRSLHPEQKMAGKVARRNRHMSRCDLFKNRLRELILSIA